MNVTATHSLGALVLRDREFRVPLDHADPTGENITVFAREVTLASKDAAELPWLVFLQGGPGFPSPRPNNASGWLGWACQQYRVLLLDQRGTGRSTRRGRGALWRDDGIRGGRGEGEPRGRQRGELRDVRQGSSVVPRPWLPWQSSAPPRAR